MHTWHWFTWERLSYLRCSLLEPWPHGFFTQQFWPRSPLELAKALQPGAEVYRVKQVHGNVVLAPSEIGSSIGSDDEVAADGLITEQAGQAVWVAIASCSELIASCSICNAITRRISSRTRPG